MIIFFFVILAVGALSIGSVQGQTLLTQTTCGGNGSDVAEGVASAADGSSYVVGISDSFTRDPFGNPSPNSAHFLAEVIAEKENKLRRLTI
jgi:hypothetical protein